jgi:hypothetical protein
MKTFLVYVPTGETIECKGDCLEIHDGNLQIIGFDECGEPETWAFFKIWSRVIMKH